MEILPSSESVMDVTKSISLEGFEANVIAESAAPSSNLLESNSTSCLTSTVSTVPKPRRSIKRKIPKGMEHMLPPKPKRPLTTYLAFMRENHTRISTEAQALHPDDSNESKKNKFGDVGKLVGAQYHKLTPEELKPYADLAAKDKERYAREMDEWTAKCKEVTYQSMKAKKVRTRALSAYNFFMAKNRQEICEQNPDVPYTEIPKLVGEKWRSLTEQERQVYEQMANDDASRLKELREALNAKEQEAVRAAKVAQTKVPKKRTKKVAPTTKPKKNAAEQVASKADHMQYSQMKYSSNQQKSNPQTSAYSSLLTAEHASYGHYPNDLARTQAAYGLANRGATAANQAGLHVNPHVATQQRLTQALNPQSYSYSQYQTSLSASHPNVQAYQYYGQIQPQVTVQQMANQAQASAQSTQAQAHLKSQQGGSNQGQGQSNVSVYGFSNAMPNQQF